MLATWTSLLLFLPRLGRRTMFIIGLSGAFCMHTSIAVSSELLKGDPLLGWFTLGFLLVFLFFAQGFISSVMLLVNIKIIIKDFYFFYLFFLPPKGPRPLTWAEGRLAVSESLLVFGAILCGPARIMCRFRILLFG